VVLLVFYVSSHGFEGVVGSLGVIKCLTLG
jgi:hypothetical protein